MSLADEIEKFRREVARGAGADKVRMLMDALECQRRDAAMPSTTNLDLGEAAAEISNRIYFSSVGLLERLEHAGKIAGSGHHAAQLIAKMAEQELRERWANMDRIRRDVETMNEEFRESGMS